MINKILYDNYIGNVKIDLFRFKYNNLLYYIKTSTYQMDQHIRHLIRIVLIMDYWYGQIQQIHKEHLMETKIRMEFQVLYDGV